MDWKMYETELTKEGKSLSRYKLWNTRKLECVEKELLIPKAGDMWAFSCKRALKENPGGNCLRNKPLDKIAEESSCHWGGRAECCGHINRPCKAANLTAALLTFVDYKWVSNCQTVGDLAAGPRKVISPYIGIPGASSSLLPWLQW